MGFHIRKMIMNFQVGIISHFDASIFYSQVFFIYS